MSDPEIVRADELLTEAGDQPDLEYLPLLGLDGYLVRGWTHLLAGFPRTGKTHLLLHIVIACADLGLCVLYVTEEARQLWRLRLSSFPGAWQQRLYLLFALGVPPERLRKLALERDEPVLVLDAIRSLLGFVDENDNSEVTRTVTPWIVGARAREKTLIAVHHTRKGGGSGGEGIAGAHALMASFDVALELKRDDHDHRRRGMRTYARLISPADLMYEMTAGGALEAVGTPGDVALEKVRERLRPIYSLDWLKTSEVRANLENPKPSPAQLARALEFDLQADLIERDPPVGPSAARGKTYRWRLRPGAPVPPKEGSGGSSLFEIGTEVRAALPKGTQSLHDGDRRPGDDGSRDIG